MLSICRGLGVSNDSIFPVFFFILYIYFFFAPFPLFSYLAPGAGAG